MAGKWQQVTFPGTTTRRNGDSPHAPNAISDDHADGHSIVRRHTLLKLAHNRRLKARAQEDLCFPAAG